MLSCAGVGVGYSWLGWVVQLVCTCVAWTSTDQFNPVYILTYNIYTYIHTHTPVFGRVLDFGGPGCSILSEHAVVKQWAKSWEISSSKSDLSTLGLTLVKAQGICLTTTIQLPLLGCAHPTPQIRKPLGRLWQAGSEDR